MKHKPHKKCNAPALRKKRAQGRIARRWQAVDSVTREWGRGSE
jgi:hypothetical protein